MGDDDRIDRSHQPQVLKKEGGGHRERAVVLQPVGRVVVLDASSVVVRHRNIACAQR
jgi:hypothetical protein